MAQPQFHPLRVAAVEPLTDDSVALTFDVPPELADDYGFVHGQHLTIRGDDGERRSFSICTPPRSGRAPHRREEAARRRVQPGVVDTLRVGDELDVMTPAGRFTTTLDPASAKTYVAIAAGSGITPVLSIVATLLEDEPHAQVTLIYANRTHSTVMFLEELARPEGPVPRPLPARPRALARAAGRRAPLGPARRRAARPHPRRPAAARRGRRVVPVRPPADGRRPAPGAPRPRRRGDRRTHRAVPRRPCAAGPGSGLVVASRAPRT